MVMLVGGPASPTVWNFQAEVEEQLLQELAGTANPTSVTEAVLVQQVQLTATPVTARAGGGGGSGGCSPHSRLLAGAGRSRWNRWSWR